MPSALLVQILYKPTNTRKQTATSIKMKLGIDTDNTLLIHDSASSIISRGSPCEGHPLGKPTWISKPGSFTVSWEEFDRSQPFLFFPPPPSSFWYSFTNPKSV
eukprot:TRINITY_DN4295_c0_g2_i3.p1 TRINITY_DN4295_c0_g2~~TRINITY_DN4295_c0_g2_i3.p1  ORF type:complete len:103 (-),score=16.68 TRINITY_DN4295_c0_g2_i3:393-701(-)